METKIINLKWVKSVDGPNCTHSCSVKNGRTKCGRQRLRCKICGRTYMKEYTSNAWHQATNSKIRALLKEGVGIGSGSKVLIFNANGLNAL